MDGAGGTPLLVFDAVHKAYGARGVLRGVGFTVAAGEAVALAGLNGAGKTTLLACLLDLLALDGGRITVVGYPHRELAARAGLAFLPERFLPPPYATGTEFLRHLLALHGVALDPAAAVREATALALDPAALARPAREYSKGMAQKLGLVACLLAARPLLVLDEPLSGLDPLARSRVKARLARHREEGGALLYSTHLLADAAELCTRLVLLHDGQVAFDGRPAELAPPRGEGLEAAFLARIGAA